MEHQVWNTRSNTSHEIKVPDRKALPGAVTRTVARGMIESNSEPYISNENAKGEKVENFAVIDTETNWNDEVMSIGIVIADGATKEKIASKYYIITPEYRVGGMFSHELRSSENEARITDRKQALGGAFYIRRLHDRPGNLFNWELSP